MGEEKAYSINLCQSCELIFHGSGTLGDSDRIVKDGIIAVDVEGRWGWVARVHLHSTVSNENGSFYGAKTEHTS